MPLCFLLGAVSFEPASLCFQWLRVTSKPKARAEGQLETNLENILGVLLVTNGINLMRVSEFSQEKKNHINSRALVF